MKVFLIEGIYLLIPVTSVIKSSISVIQVIGYGVTGVEFQTWVRLSLFHHMHPAVDPT
jgi:hypothetical protein